MAGNISSQGKESPMAAKILFLCEAAKALGLSSGQMERMVASGVVQPVRHSGPGRPSCFDRRDLTAGGLARNLLGQGWPLAKIATVTGWLYTMPFEVVEEELAEGKTHLIATSANGAAPRLVDAADLGLFAAVFAKATIAGHGVCVADLKLCLERVDAYLADFEPINKSATKAAKEKV